MSRTLLALLVSTSAAFAADPSRPPNVVLVMADDFGWADAGCYGSRFHQTPNIDRLAERGLRFTDYYAANPLCSPTRASVLTGQYPGRLRFTTPSGHVPEVVLDPGIRPKGPPNQKALIPETRTRLPNEYVTVAEALKEAGYATAFVGKWHLGRAPYLPENQGFDVVVGGRENPGPPPPGNYFAPWGIDTLPTAPAGTHVTDVTTDAAIEFLRANRDRSFFLNYWPYSVHAPFQAEPELIEKHRKRVDPSDPQRCPTMAAMIEALDRNVGRLTAALDELGLADNTLLLFTSDNGGNMYSDVEGEVPTSNAPLRGGKAMIYEGGIRVPMVAVWPGRIEPGKTTDAVACSIDLYPTLLEVAGRDPKPGQILDGVSLLATLTGGGRPDREALFCHFPHYTPATGNRPATSVRRGDWKLIRFHCDADDRSDRHELYNLRDDLGESTDLAAQRPDLGKELDALISKHLEETAALVPVPNPAYDPSAPSPPPGKKPTRKRRAPAAAP